MEATFIVIINILLIPFISLFILYQKNCNSLGTKFETIMKYGIFIVLISITTELILRVILILFEKEITSSSSYYTVIATGVALCLPFVINTVKLKIVYTKEESKKADEEKEPEEK